jgi:hypothetical protein
MTYTAHRTWFPNDSRSPLFYVESLPSRSAADYGYTEDPKRAANLSEKEARAFIRYCEHVGSKSCGTNPPLPTPH